MTKLVANERAVKILRELGVISKVDVSIPYILKELRKRSKISKEEFHDVVPYILNSSFAKNKNQNRRLP